MATVYKKNEAELDPTSPTKLGSGGSTIQGSGSDIAAYLDAQKSLPGSSSVVSAPAQTKEPAPAGTQFAPNAIRMENIDPASIGINPAPFGKPNSFLNNPGQYSEIERQFQSKKKQEALSNLSNNTKSILSKIK